MCKKHIDAMKYIKKFATYSEYQAYYNGSLANSNELRPHLSLCAESDKAHCLAKIPVVILYGGSGEISTTFLEEDGIIPQSAFSYNHHISSAELKYEVKKISDCAFLGCGGLSSVIIPNSVTSIGRSAFDGCTSLTSVTIPDSVTSIGNYAFRGYKSLTSVTIPSSVTSISQWAFGVCTDLTSVAIPDSVTSIGGGAFYGCSDLKSVTVPNSVTKIYDNAFEGCSGLKSVTIGSGITHIGYAAFADCSRLASFTCLAETPPSFDQTALLNTNNSQIYVPSESVDAYKEASGWIEYASRIQAIPSD